MSWRSLGIHVHIGVTTACIGVVVARDQPVSTDVPYSDWTRKDKLSTENLFT